MLRRIITLLIWLASTGLSLDAGSAAPADFASALQPILGNLRTAASYASTGNIALAQIESGEAMAAWNRLQRQFAGAAPPPYTSAAFDAFLAAGRERLAAADHALELGDSLSAGDQLRSLRQSFHDLRRASGLYDLGDCVAEIGSAMEVLRVAASRFNEDAMPRRAEDTVAAAGVFRDRLQRCNEWAGADVAGQPEFRRLIDGAIASSGEIARAAVAGDGPLVHRYLIELQSYAQLLDFRFG